jgi:hypothetical protein
MRQCWLKITSVSAFFMGSLALTGTAPAKPKSPSELAKGPAKNPMVRAAPRKVVQQSQVHNTQAPRAPGVRVYRDPDTGEVREGTHEEARALEGQGHGGPTLAPKPLRQVTFSDGSVAVELDDSYMTHVIVERAPDGTLHTRCKTADEQAQTSGTSPRPAPPPQIEME